ETYWRQVNVFAHVVALRSRAVWAALAGHRCVMRPCDPIRVRLPNTSDRPANTCEKVQADWRATESTPRINPESSGGNLARSAQALALHAHKEPHVLQHPGPHAPSCQLSRRSAPTCPSQWTAGRPPQAVGHSRIARAPMRRTPAR